MATLREIKRRIDSVKSTMQITKAMKMVAAAKLRKSQSRLLNTRPYAKELGNVMQHISVRSVLKKHPLFKKKNKDTVCFVLVTADSGLCGSFNSYLIQKAYSEMEQAESEGKKSVLITIGKKGYEHFKRRDFKIAKNYIELFTRLEFDHAQEIASDLLKLYNSNKFEKIVLIYNKFKSVVQQELTVEQFLPVIPSETDKDVSVGSIVFEPKPEKLLTQLIPMHLNFQIWRVLLESATSEFGARMTAMETATDNAQEMIKELVLFYNKARQAAITTELNEIVSGAEALHG